MSTYEPHLSAEEIEFLHSIFDMVREGQVLKVTSLLEQGIPANLTDAKGDSLLILSVYHQHKDIVQVLLAHGADINAMNDRGQTPLVCAVFRNNLELVQLLVEAGADLTLGSQSPLDVAEFFGLEEMKHYLGEQLSN